MIIKVYGVSQMALTPQEQENKTKYYQPPITKEEVKNDFDMVFDAEMKKLHVDVLI